MAKAYPRIVWQGTVNGTHYRVVLVDDDEFTFYVEKADDNRMKDVAWVTLFDGGEDGDDYDDVLTAALDQLHDFVTPDQLPGVE